MSKTNVIYDDGRGNFSEEKTYYIARAVLHYRDAKGEPCTAEAVWGEEGLGYIGWTAAGYPVEFPTLNAARLPTGNVVEINRGFKTLQVRDIRYERVRKTTTQVIEPVE